MTTIVHLPFPARPVDRHICVPRYRAADGKYTRCWCGADVRDEGAQVVSLRSRRQAADRPCDTEGGSAA